MPIQDCPDFTPVNIAVTITASTLLDTPFDSVDTTVLSACIHLIESLTPLGDGSALVYSAFINQNTASSVTLAELSERSYRGISNHNTTLALFRNISGVKVLCFVAPGDILPRYRPDLIPISVCHSSNPLYTAFRNQLDTRFSESGWYSLYSADISALGTHIARRFQNCVASTYENQTERSVPSSTFAFRIPVLSPIQSDITYQTYDAPTHIPAVSAVTPIFPTNNPVIAITGGSVSLSLSDTGDPLLTGAGVSNISAPVWNPTSQTLWFHGVASVEDYVNAFNTVMFSDFSGVAQTHTVTYAVFNNSNQTGNITEQLPRNVSKSFDSGLLPFGTVPKGTRNLHMELSAFADRDDDFEVFTRDGTHIIGTRFGDYVWQQHEVNAQNVDTRVITMDNGFNAGATYQDHLMSFTWESGAEVNTNTFRGMTFSYSGDEDGTSDNDGASDTFIESYSIDVVTEDLIIFVVGRGTVRVTMTYESMPVSPVFSNVASTTAEVHVIRPVAPPLPDAYDHPGFITCNDIVVSNGGTLLSTKPWCSRISIVGQGLLPQIDEIHRMVVQATGPEGTAISLFTGWVPMGFTVLGENTDRLEITGTSDASTYNAVFENIGNVCHNIHDVETHVTFQIVWTLYNDGTDWQRVNGSPVLSTYESQLLAHFVPTPPTSYTAPILADLL